MGRHTASTILWARWGTSWPGRTADGPARGSQIFLVESTSSLELVSKVGNDGFGQHGDAVFEPLPVTNHDLLVGKVDVFDSQPQTFEQSHTGSIEESEEQQMLFRDMAEEELDLLPRQHDRELAFGLGSDQSLQLSDGLIEHLLVEKDQSTEGLRLGRAADSALVGKVRQGGRRAGGRHPATRARGALARHPQLARAPEG